MIRRQLFDFESSTYTYLLGDESSRSAVIIDPVLSKVYDYLKILDQIGLTLQMSIDTHTHADHITAQSLLHELTGCQMLVNSQSQTTCNCPTFDDSEDINCGNFKLTPVYTPGHTIDSYSFYIVDSGQPILFTGDTLLIRGTGRTDFQGGSAAHQYESIFGTLLKFPDETLVFPGHDYKGWLVSTIGEEKAFNPRLQVSEMSEYIDLMANLNLPPPKNMHLALPANRACGRIDGRAWH